ncbi:MAG: hypothetical protein OCD02_23015 [Spirochaetaceae bacterium]
MKKILLVTLLLAAFNLYSEDRLTSYSISAGTEYLEEFFVNFGFSLIKPLNDNKELDIKVALNLNTENVDENDDVEPMFNIPIKVGINFLFPQNEVFTFLVGTGLSPTIRLTGDDKGFLIGPNIKLGARYKIHPSMNIILEACQSLLIGEPDWMYPSTEVVLGVNFYL